MPQRSLKEMAILETTYGQIARHVIWGSKEVRDITNWIVTCNLTQRLIRYARSCEDSHFALVVAQCKRI